MVQSSDFEKMNFLSHSNYSVIFGILINII